MKFGTGDVYKTLLASVNLMEVVYLFRGVNKYKFFSVVVSYLGGVNK
jgi:hypothetical protein